LRWYVGFIHNLLDYKHLISEKHGNLGLLILPGSFFSAILAITLLFYALYRLFESAYRNLINFYQIKFDILTLLDFKIDSFYLNINTIILLAILSILLGIMIIYGGKVISKEKTKIKTSYILYVFFYWPLFAFWWTLSGIFKLFGKKVEWGRKNINEF